MRRVTDYLHSRGKTCELHSCGQNYKQDPNMIKAGWDRWNPQPMNDTDGLYDQYGDKLTEVRTTDLRLSDCQPIMTAEGDVVLFIC